MIEETMSNRKSASVCAICPVKDTDYERVQEKLLRTALDQ